MMRSRPVYPPLRRAGGVAVLALAAAGLAGCASRHTNPPLSPADLGNGYRMSSWQAERGDPAFAMVVAMSGGGTRAAAFS